MAEYYMATGTDPNLGLHVSEMTDRGLNQPRACISPGPVCSLLSVQYKGSAAPGKIHDRAVF